MCSAGDLENLKAAAAQRGSDMAKLQIQYSMLLKENNMLRERQEQMIEDLRLAKVQLDNERKLSRELKTEKTNFYSRRN